MLNLQELEIFVVAAEQCNFSKAGRILHLSQPAISQTIHSLETRYGVKLFLRSGRSVRLSDAGASLLPMIRELIANAKRLEENMALIHGQIAGHLTIGCTTTAGKYLLPRMVAQIRNKNPQLRIDIPTSRRESLIKRLLSDDIQFGLSSKIPDHDDLVYLPFYSDEVILIASSDHHWAQHPHIYPDDLLDTPLILRESTSGNCEILFRQLQTYDITPDMLDVAMVLGNEEAIAMAVSDQIGVGFVSKLVASQGIENGRIVQIYVEGLELIHDLVFMRNKRRPMSRSQAVVWEFMQTNSAVPSVSI